MTQYSLGIDVGTSFIKVCLLDLATGQCVALKTTPAQEQPILCPHPEWAEQDPEMWWTNITDALSQISEEHDLSTVSCIGISYQMHGLICLDEGNKPLRHAILWCDGRAVTTGDHILEELGKDQALMSLRNAPANFTFSRLRWLQMNEPQLFSRIHKVLLPGEYIAYKLSQSLVSSFGGASEQILWDFEKKQFASWVVQRYDIPLDIFPTMRPCASIHCHTSLDIAQLLGIPVHTPISLLGGDQTINGVALGAFTAQSLSSTAAVSPCATPFVSTDAVPLLAPVAPTGTSTTTPTVTHDPTHSLQGSTAAADISDTEAFSAIPLAAAVGTSGNLYGLAPRAGPYVQGINWFVHANATFGCHEEGTIGAGEDGKGVETYTGMEGVGACSHSVMHIGSDLAGTVEIKEGDCPEPLQGNAVCGSEPPRPDYTDAGALLCVSGGGCTYSATIASLFSAECAEKGKQCVYSDVNDLAEHIYAMNVANNAKLTAHSPASVTTAPSTNASAVHVTVLPFGNGPERMLDNRSTGHCIVLTATGDMRCVAAISDVDRASCGGRCLVNIMANNTRTSTCTSIETDAAAADTTYCSVNATTHELDRHSILLPFSSFAAHTLCDECRGQVVVATMEALAFSLYYGAEMMRKAGVRWNCLRVGKGGLSKSHVFRNILATLFNVPVQVVNTEVAVGAARGAAVGAGLWKDWTEAGKGIDIVETVVPHNHLIRNELLRHYGMWQTELANKLYK